MSANDGGDPIRISRELIPRPPIRRGRFVVPHPDPTGIEVGSRFTFSTTVEDEAGRRFAVTYYDAEVSGVAKPHDLLPSEEYPAVYAFVGAEVVVTWEAE